MDPEVNLHPDLGSIFKKVVVALLVVLLDFVGLDVAWHRHSPEQRFVIPNGASAHVVAHQLREQHLILHPWLFLLWVKLNGHVAALKPGTYDLKPSLTGHSIYENIRRGPPLMRVTFPEGWTSKQMAALLESRGITPANDFIAEVDKEKREGFLFPDTYFFEQN